MVSIGRNLRQKNFRQNTRVQALLRMVSSWRTSYTADLSRERTQTRTARDNLKKEIAERKQIERTYESLQKRCEVKLDECERNRRRFEEERKTNRQKIADLNAQIESLKTTHQRDVKTAGDVYAREMAKAQSKISTLQRERDTFIAMHHNKLRFIDTLTKDHAKVRKTYDAAIDALQTTVANAQREIETLHGKQAFYETKLSEKEARITSLIKNHNDQVQKYTNLSTAAVAQLRQEYELVLKSMKSQRDDASDWKKTCESLHRMLQDEDDRNAKFRVDQTMKPSGKRTT